MIPPPASPSPLNHTDHPNLLQGFRSADGKELRNKLQMMQKLQADLIQMIEKQECADGGKINQQMVMEQSSYTDAGQRIGNDEAIKHLVEEHPHLLKAALTISNSREKPLPLISSSSPRTPHRGEEVTNLSCPSTTQLSICD